MKNALKTAGKILLQGVLWVFVLSLNWQGRTLYSYAQEIIVQNQVVQAADAQLAEWWQQLRTVTVAKFRSDTDAHQNGQM